MIQMIASAVTMTVIYLVIHHLHRKDDPPKGQECSHYIIRVPSALTAAYSVLFWMGIALFVLWGIFYLNGVSGLTAGHFIFALACAGVGLLVVVWASRWRITVDGDAVTVHRLLRKEQQLSLRDVAAVRQEKNTRMGVSSRIVLWQDGKKVATVDWTCENYTQLEQDLTQAGKLPESKSIKKKEGHHNGHGTRH